MFPISLNVAAQSIVADGKYTYNSFTDATFLLKIEFMGVDQNGNMIKIPNTDKFLPIKFEKLKLKLEAAAKAGYDKAITFEFSHFMSPQSAYIQAHHLYNRYLEFKNSI
jgi:hypothetical protein